MQRPQLRKHQNLVQADNFHQNMVDANPKDIKPLCRAILTHSQNNMEVCSQPEITNTRSQPCLRAIVGPYLCGIHTCHLQLETARPQLCACMVILYLSLTACSHTIYNCFVSTSKLCMLMQKGALKSTLSSEMENALSGAVVMIRPHASRCRELRACLLHAGQRAAGGRDVKALAGRCQRGTRP